MAAGDQVVDAAEDAQRAQRGDDRRDPEDRDDDAVDHPEDEADARCPNSDRRGRVEQRGARATTRDAVGDQPDRRLDRQVDVAGDDHERLADGRDGDDRREDRDLAEVVDASGTAAPRSRRSAPSTTMIATRLSSRWRAIAPSQLARRGRRRDRRSRARQPSAVPPPARRPRRRSSAPCCPVAANITRSSVASVARDLGRDPALVEDEDPVGHREDLGQVARDEDDREPRRGELGDDPVDLDLGPDVDARGSARRGSGRVGFDASHLASTTFCWLPPDSAPTSWSTPVIRTLNWSRVARRRPRARSTPRTRSRGNSRGRIGSVTFWAIEKSSTRPSWWRSSGR